MVRTLGRIFSSEIYRDSEYLFISQKEKFQGTIRIYISMILHILFEHLIDNPNGTDFITYYIQSQIR